MLKSCSTLSLAATVALLTVIVPSQPFFRPTMALPAAFEVPTSVPSDTSLQVSSGSDAMTLISDALKADFEGKFDGAAVNVDAVGANQAIQALINGDADLAAISRPLTENERAQGLSAVDVNRIKIAMIVGEDNPFSKSLTTEQFAKIFRGEITDWSEVGGPSGAIRLVDRPDTSDTRLALAPYPVFQAAEFATGSSASQLNTDSTKDIAKELGADGISYGLISEVEDLAGVRILSMHKTLPTDPRYPFSQPFSFVYKGEPSPAVAAFLGYAAGEPGQSALKAANPLDGVVSAASNTVQSAADAAGNVVEGAADAAGNVVEGATDAAGNVVEGAVDVAGNVVEGATDAAGNVVEGAADAAGNVVEGAADAAGNVVEGAADAAGNVVEGAADAASDAASNVAAATNQEGRDVSPQSSISRANLWWLLIVPAACLGLVAWGARRKDKDATYATAQGPNVASGVSGVGKAAGAGIAAGTAAGGSAAWSAAKKTGDAAKGGLDNVSDAARGGLGTVKGGLGNVGDAARGGLGTVKGGLGNVGDAAKGGLGTVKGGLGNVGDAARGGLGTVKDGLGNVGDAARGGLGTVKDGLGNVGDAARGGLGTVKDGLGNVGDAAKDGLGTVKGAAQQGGSGLKGGLGSASNAVQSGANAVTGKLGGMADDAGNAIKGSTSAPRSLWQRVRNNVNNTADSVTDKTSDMANQAKQQAGNLKDQAGQLGQRGINKASDVADKLTDLDG